MLFKNVKDGEYNQGPGVRQEALLHIFIRWLQLTRIWVDKKEQEGTYFKQLLLL